MAAVVQLPRPLSRVDQIRIACNAANHFVRNYYEALSTPSTSIEKLASFYAPLDDNMDIAKSFFTFKNIWYNGNEFSSPAEFATAVKDYLTPARYEIDSYDCQTLNPDLNPTRDVVRDPSKGGAMSILLSVSGECRIGPMKESEAMDFSETIVLVPNLNHESPEAVHQSNNQNFLYSKQQESCNAYHEKIRKFQRQCMVRVPSDICNVFTKATQSHLPCHDIRSKQQGSCVINPQSLNEMESAGEWRDGWRQSKVDAWLYTMASQDTLLGDTDKDNFTSTSEVPEIDMAQSTAKRSCSCHDVGKDTAPAEAMEGIEYYHCVTVEAVGSDDSCSQLTSEQEI